MGKIRKIVMGDLEAEEEQKRRADARRQTKQAKKAKVEGVGLKGGERTAVVEGTDIKPEFKKLIDEVETGEEAKVKKKKAKKKAEDEEKTGKTRSKKYLEKAGLIEKNKLYAISDAVKLVKQTSYTKFDGTVEIHVNINPKTLEKDKKDVRGTLTLPHGSGKTIRVVEATDEIIKEIEAGKINFEVLVARPQMMPKLAKFARLLGPKGLMPNPKTQTVTDKPAERIKELSQGQTNYKSEPDNAIIHLPIGKVSFDDEKLADNIKAVINALGKNRIEKATITATMGPGIKLAVS